MGFFHLLVFLLSTVLFFRLDVSCREKEEEEEKKTAKTTTTTTTTTTKKRKDKDTKLLYTFLQVD